MNRGWAAVDRVDVGRSGLITAAVTAATFMAACQPVDEAAPSPAQQPAAVPVPRVDVPASGAFALGVEYTESGLAGVYAESGVSWAKTRLEAFSWGAIEPSPPVGRTHSYDWSCTDALIGEYQQAGIINLQSYLDPRSPWGNQPGREPRPSDEHWDDYLAWVTALAERYDADGTGDMPGLVAPVRDWVVGGEWTGFWKTDDAAGYVETLAATSETIRAAHPQARIGSIPFMLYDVFGGYPTEAEIARRVGGRAPTFRNSMDGLGQILDAHEYFDYVTFHSLGDYSEIEPSIAWLGDELDRRAVTADIWVDDAVPTSLMANLGWPVFEPVAANEHEIRALLAEIAADPTGDAASWLRAETAKGLVHKVVVAAASGASGINIGNTEDWLHDDIAAVRGTQMALLGASGPAGLVDVSHPGGYQVCDVRMPGVARPAYANLTALVEIFDRRLISASRLGSPAAVHAYELVTDAGTTWVLWAEDGVVQVPGQHEALATYELDLGQVGTHVRLRTAATDSPELPTVVLPIGDGPMLFELGSVPVFVDLLS